MQLTVIDVHDLTIPGNRQRKEFKPEEITKLADSISQNGLIQPLVIRRDGPNLLLVAGERRLRALQYVWNFGQSVRCGEVTFPEGAVPCIYQGEMDPIDAFEMELEENIRRVDLDWKEKAAATSQLYELRRLQAERRGDDPPSIAAIAQEVRGDSGFAYEETRSEILVSKHLDDPDVQKAKSVGDAFKVLKRKEETRKNAELGIKIGATFNASVHTLMKGDCIDLMGNMEESSVDVILSDPPYGMEAQGFGDSGGMLTIGSHFYDDSFENWSQLMQRFAVSAYRVAKADAHAYLFCDIDNFVFLKSYMSVAGWKCFRTPLVWVNPSGMRAPWPDKGPQRKWQICLYAVKGEKTVNKLYGDVLTYGSDENLGHPAQKPVALYTDLLRRSVRPGDVVLDPFCGSGPIFPAAHEFKCRAIGIELDDSAYGISVRRLDSLK